MTKLHLSLAKLSGHSKAAHWKDMAKQATHGGTLKIIKEG